MLEFATKVAVELVVHFVHTLIESVLKVETGLVRLRGKLIELKFDPELPYKASGS